jgi:mono/diheme cytochrome c family protein
MAGAFIFSSRALAQGKTPSNKKATIESRSAGERAAIARGLVVYKDRCAICHFSESDAKKIGPGLGGIYKREKFTGGGKVDDASMEKWILNGGKNMPPFKSVINPNQARDLITYLKTLR